MMQKNWWDEDEIVAPQQGGVITKPADPTLPYKTTQERYQAQSAPYDAQKAQADAQRAQIEARYAESKAQADAAKAAADAEKARVDAAKGPQWNEYQSKSTAFLRRALGANVDFEGLDIGPRSWVGEALHDRAPSLLNQLPSSIGNSPSRQRADSTQDEFIAATLRQDSGAAIPPEELERQRQIYFPQAGETSPEIIAQKREARRRAIQGLMDSGGPAVPDDIRQNASEWLKSFDQGASFDDQLKAALQDPTKSPRERLQAALAISRENNRPINMKDAAAAAQAGRVDNLESDPSLASQAWGHVKNVGAGLAEGITALPDMLAKGAGEVMAAPFDVLGYGNIASGLRDVPQFGNAIEKAVPTPQDWNGWLSRKAAELEGGVVGLPQGLLTNIAERVAGKVPNALPPTSKPPTGLLGDAASLGIEPTAAAVGGPVSKVATSLFSQTLGGVKPIAEGAQRMVTQGGNALKGIAAREGVAAGPEGMGQAATSGALKYRDASRDTIGKIYDQAAKIAGDARVKPDRTIAALDENIAQLSQVPGGADGATYLQSLRDEIAKNFPEGVTVQGFRGMRTALRDKFFKDGLRGSDLERRVNGVVAMVSDDLTQSLIAQGKGGAANLFRKADSEWAKRVDAIDNVIMPIIGRRGEKDGTQVAKALTSAAQGNGSRFKQFVASLPEEEAGTVRASLIDALGRAKPGVQGADGDTFSFASFLTNYNNLSKTAKAAMFKEGDQAALDRLARVSEGVKDAARYANHSNTGGAVVNAMTLTGGYGIGGIPGGMLTVLGTYLGGKALASPGVARAVARLGEAKTPGQMKYVIEELKHLATRNPAAANEIMSMRDQLTRALNDNFTSGAVASQPNEEQNRHGY